MDGRNQRQRRRIDIPDAIDLATGQTRMIEALYPTLAPVHVFRANARYLHPPGSQSRVVEDWLPSVRHSIVPRATEPLALFARPGRRIISRRVRLPNRRA